MVSLPYKFYYSEVIMSLTLEECTRILTMLEDGHSQRNTARTVGVTLSTVQRVLQRFHDTGSNIRRPGIGRTRCMTAREDRYMVSTILRNRFLMAVEVNNHHLRAGGNNLSTATVRRRLAEANLKPLRPANGPKLERHHRNSRLSYGRAHENWTLNDWSRVMFQTSLDSVYTSTTGGKECTEDRESTITKPV